MSQSNRSFQKITQYLEQSVSIAPLVTFRMAFGLLMLFSTVRYMWMGWVDTQLVDPVLHFSYYGFDWVEPLPRLGMYAVFIVMSLTSIFIAIGFWYRLSTILFFFLFTYVELIDITYYLNHYYFVSIVAFLLIIVPANRYFSLDAFLNPSIRREKVSRWCIDIFKFQIAIVYCYAGLAKINHDWLINALPLSIWLPAKSSLPIIGWMFNFSVTAYIFSWAGMLFDTFIIGGLLWRKSRWLAYMAVVVFHTITGVLFQIGIFPLVMILVVTIFFSPDLHEKFLKKLSIYLPKRVPLESSWTLSNTSIQAKRSLLTYSFLFVFVSFQIIFPWRYLLYPGNVFWTEEGYRFAWRVMLMEKAGTATFYIKDAATQKEGSVINHQFLNPHQEKQMAMQPDLILQFAHYLKDHFQAQGVSNPSVRAEVLVTLNASPAQLLIDPQVDLATQEDGWQKKNWILPFNN